MKKRILSLLLALVMLVGLLPTVALAAAGNPATQVHVTVENTTFTAASEASNWLEPEWSGKEIDTWITLTDELTMMDCIRLAIEDAKWEQTGAEDGYIREINGVGEFDNGSESGWMGTLNDWFTNYGFANYKVSDGTLKPGDEIRVMYTSTGLGADIGGDWGNDDKRVKSIAVTGGALAPAFTPDNHEYTLTIPAGMETTSVTVVPTAMNKQYQVHTYVGETEYRRTESIPVTPGTVITVKSGDPDWETACDNTAPAEVYTINVVTPGVMLNKDSLSITTSKEDATGTGADITLSYDTNTATFSGTLSAYTHLAKYNDAGFTAKLTGLPEGAAAVLTDETGTKIADFVDGTASTTGTPLAGTGVFTYYLVVTKDDVTENYALTLDKTCQYGWSTFNFISTPAFNADNVLHDYPEGTLLQADRTGEPTGKIGYSADCWNYVMYVTPTIQSVGVESMMKCMPNSSSSGLKAKILVDGEVHVQHANAKGAMMQFANKPVALTKEKTVIDIVWNHKTDKTVEIHTTLTVIVVKTTPEELTARIEALPDIDSLVYTADYKTAQNYDRVYKGYTEEEKAQISAETLKKLTDSLAKLETLKKRHEDGIQAWKDGVNTYAGKVTAGNYAQYYDAVKESERSYLALSDAQRKEIDASTEKTAYDAAYQIVDTGSIQDGSSIGKPTNYPDDFMMGANHYNLELGHEDTYYRAVFREIWTNRPESLYTSTYVGEKGVPFTLKGILSFDIKDESIFEIKEVDSVYGDLGLGGNNAQIECSQFYLVPKKAGTTTFTVTLRDTVGNFLGQIPEIPVHVNSPEETAIEGLNDKLTNFNSLSNTTKYDNWTYEYGQPGAEFSFHVNGDNGKVWVYNYLEYNADGTPVKTSYSVDGNGDVTILLKDGYNCIEVNADYEGQNVTQVYSLKGKVMEYVQENVSRPGEPLRTGDTAGIWMIGKPEAIHKILRIYNMGGKPVFKTDMPQQSYLPMKNSILVNWAGFSWESTMFSYSRIDAPLTASGDITLTDGVLEYRGYGSSPGSEGDQGNTGGIADSTHFGFGKLANIHLHVAENEKYQLETKYETVASNNGVVKAGEQITISVPTLPIEQYTKEVYLMYATLNFATTIPNASGIISKWSRGTDSWTYEGETGVAPEVALKNITFTVPAATPAGTYRIYGGYVDSTYRPGSEAFLDYYETLYSREIGDITITVLPGAQEDVIELIDAIGEVTAASGDAIRAARKAYDALTEAQRELVSNYQELLDAEARYRELTTPVIPVTPSKPSAPKDDAAAVDASKFGDVSKNNWYFDAVQYVVENGLMNGTSAGAFSPNADTTRGMIVTILARLDGADTTGTPWYAAGRAWAMQNGISDGTNMEGKITREQLAAMLYRYAKLKGYDVSASADISAYADAAGVSGWALDAMQWAVGAGLIQGSNNMLTPQANASRAQIAAILMRFAQKIAK